MQIRTNYFLILIEIKKLTTQPCHIPHPHLCHRAVITTLVHSHALTPSLPHSLPYSLTHLLTPSSSFTFQVSSLVANFEHAEVPGGQKIRDLPPGGKRFPSDSAGAPGSRGGGGGGGGERPKKATEERDCSNPLSSIIAPFTSMLG